MTKDKFLKALQAETNSFAKAVSTDEGQWIIKGFIDVEKKIYTISKDTKTFSKVFELLLIPLFEKFAKKHKMKLHLSTQQNFYPDFSFENISNGKKYAVDIKSTYRTGKDTVNGMTLGAFTGYFRNRKSNKNIVYPYDEYEGHFVFGIIYTQCSEKIDERKIFKITDLAKIPSVIHTFQFFVQPKYKIAVGKPGSGNTKNIGSCQKISELLNGTGPFSKLSEEVYDDYWMYFLTNDMAKTLGIPRPYNSIKTYFEYKKKGIETLTKHEKEIKQLSENESYEKEEL